MTFDVMSFGQREEYIFLMVLVRMTGLFIIAPVFAHASIPKQVKALLAFSLTLVTYPLVAASQVTVPETVVDLLVVILRELACGATLGYVALLVFAAAQLAGELIDTQIGFGLANLVDPSFGMQITVIGQLQFLVATMLFLSVNGHYALIGAIMRSYDVVPIGGAAMSAELLQLIAERFTGLFVAAMQMAIPVVSCLLIAEIALGILARSVPQMNVLMVGMPLKIMVGLGVIGLAMPGFADCMASLFAKLFETLSAVLRAIAA